jgi:hypothetical protein
MPYLQPTVRQLQPLGRHHHSALLVPEEVDPHAPATDTASPNANTSAPRRRRWRHRPAAHPTLSS